MLSRFLLSFISTLVVVLMMTPSVAAKPSSFVGTWKLDQLYDGTDAPVAVPTSKDFILSLTPSGDGSADHYQLSIQIGNSLSSLVQVTDPTASSTAIHIKFVRSTMMMPPQELFTLEMFLTDAFPKMETITLEEPVLTMKGPAAKIVFSRQEVN
jgi:hypothetical protein